MVPRHSITKDSLVNRIYVMDNTKNILFIKNKKFRQILALFTIAFCIILFLIANQYKGKEEIIYKQLKLNQLVHQFITSKNSLNSIVANSSTNMSNYQKKQFSQQKVLVENNIKKIISIAPNQFKDEFNSIYSTFLRLYDNTGLNNNNSEKIPKTKHELYSRMVMHTLENTNQFFNNEKYKKQVVLIAAFSMLLLMSLSLISKLVHNNYQQNKKLVVKDKISLQKIDNERKLQQHQKMQALSTLSGGIAHEFNNILATIQGYTQLVMMNQIIEERDKIYLRNIHDASRRASRLVKQIMSFSRPGKDGREPHSISSVVVNALEIVEATLPENISINTNIDKHCPLVKININEIRQIIVNLCTNAWHAMEDKGGEIEVSLRTITVDHGAMKKQEKFIQMIVKDSGIGMCEDTQTRIFEPFYTTKEVGKGTGLGLAVVHGIIQSYDGNIQVNSKMNDGTEFKVNLPIKDHVSSVNQLEQSSTSVDTNQRGHVLVVDDEPNLILLYQEALRKYGYQVTLFSDSRQALEAFKLHPEKYDILLTDHAMPYMTGKQLTQECIKIKPNVQIVMATAYSELIGQDEAKRLGIRDLLVKPINTNTLVSKIQQALGETLTSNKVS